ncbi:MAG: hypothetical protein DCE90_11985 [Pseudanabaena sp.]|nr:MAG: hypothetical protein DCE90_11985 [Pseudanabaena sp.]
MSAPQRHLDFSNETSNPHPRRNVGATVQFPHNASRKSIGDRLSALVSEIEAFLRVCTYEEMCNFWEAVANLRHRLHKSPYLSEVPQFLSGRRQNRDFCRILEVLADLPYPQMHLSSQVNSTSGSRRQVARYEAQLHFVMQR